MILLLRLVTHLEELFLISLRSIGFLALVAHTSQVDKIEFRRPVDIGDLVRLKSRVVYASDDPVKPTAHVEVTCQVVRPERLAPY
jgi:hypothetical protein